MSNLERAEAEAKRQMDMGVTEVEVAADTVESKQQQAEREAAEEAERIYEEEQE